jgi:hypothetical protein
MYNGRIQYTELRDSCSMRFVTVQSRKQFLRADIMPLINRDAAFGFFTLCLCTK